MWIDTDSYKLQQDCNYDLVCNGGEPIFVKDLSLRKMDIVKDISVTMEGVSYTIAVNELNSQYDPNSEANQGQNYTYYIKAYGYDKDGHEIVVSDNMPQYNDPATINEAISAIERIDVHVIFSMGGSETIAQIISIDKPSVGTYTYDDLNNQIRLPFDLKTPDNVTLSNGSQVTFKENEIDASDGVVIIDELDSNIVDLTFNYAYTTSSGLVVHVNDLVVSKELEVTLDYDYDIVAFNDSSYIWKDAINMDYANESSPGYFGYRVDLNVICKVGNIIINNYSDYNITVNKGSKSNTGLAVLADEYVVTGADVSAGYKQFFMYHTVQSTEDNITSVDLCEFEFTINDGVKNIITYIPPASYTKMENMLDFEVFNKSNSVSLITKNNNETIDLDIQTGFDSSNYPNYAYKIKLSTDLNGNSSDYISDITTSSSVSFDNIRDQGYYLFVIPYYYNGSKYIELKKLSYDNFKSINNVIYEFGESWYDSSFSSTRSGFIRFCDEMLDKESNISITINNDDVNTKQTYSISYSNITDNTIELDNGVTLTIDDYRDDYNYISFTLSVSSSSTQYLTTADITVKDIFGNDQTYTLHE